MTKRQLSKTMLGPNDIKLATKGRLNSEKTQHTVQQVIKDREMTN